MAADSDVFQLIWECVSTNPAIRVEARRRFQDRYGADIYTWSRRVPRVNFRPLSEDDAGEFYLYLMEDRLFNAIKTFREENGCPFKAFLNGWVLKSLFRTWRESKSKRDQREVPTAPLEMQGQSGMRERRSEDEGLSFPGAYGTEENLGTEDAAQNDTPAAAAEQGGWSEDTHTGEEIQEEDALFASLCDTPQEIPEKDRVSIMREIIGTLSAEDQLLLKVFYLLMDSELTAADCSLLAEISGRSLDETLTVLAQVQRRLRRKDIKSTERREHMTQVFVEIVRKHKELQKIQEQLPPSIKGDSSPHTQELLGRKETVEAAIAMLYERRERIVHEAKTAILTTPNKDVARLWNVPQGTAAAKVHRLQKRLLRLWQERTQKKGTH